VSVPARSRGELNIAKRTSLATARLQLPVVEFIHTQGASGFLLLCAAVAAIALANSIWAPNYFRIWAATLSFDFGGVHLSKTLHHWINEGLMAVFFFLVGMEIKHEFVRGQLATWKHAVLPVVAALGGMIVPAVLYLACNMHGVRSGWGVPMATDIAFALAVIAIVPRVPLGLKIFLLALAIADDLGAIAVIAFFYTEHLNLGALALAIFFTGAIWAMGKAGVRLAFPYVVLGVLVWVCVLGSGIHATVAGVVLAFLVSSKANLPRSKLDAAVRPLLDDLEDAISKKDEESAEMTLGAIEALTMATEPPLERITRQLHSWVSFLILPIFAFSNAGVAIEFLKLKNLAFDPVAYGIAAGLVIGKPLGIVGFSWIATKLRLAELPEKTGWLQMWGAGLLGGVGFTVAIFIADLAYKTAENLQTAKLAILISSALAGAAGYIVLCQCKTPRLRRTDTPETVSLT
jgi:Na+:H+ antiporter, NhaA family